MTSMYVYLTMLNTDFDNFEICPICEFEWEDAE